MSKDAVRQRIVEIIRSGVGKSSDIAARIEQEGLRSRHSIRRTLSEMVSDGVLARTKKGMYEMGKTEISDAEDTDIADELSEDEKILEELPQFKRITILEGMVSKLKKQLKLCIRENNFEDMALEELRLSVRAFNPVVPAHYSARKADNTREEELVACLGDVHFYLDVTKETTMGIAEYNMDIARGRIQQYAEKIIDVAFADMSGIRYRVLNVFLLGDMVEFGIHDVYEGQFGTAADSLLEGAHALACFLLDCANRFEVVNVWGVPGNHSRLSEKPKFKNRYNSLDYILYQLVATMVRNQKNILFHLTKSPFTVAVINRWRFFLQHGDCIRGWAGIPFYGMDRDDKNAMEMQFDRKATEDMIIKAVTEWTESSSLDDISIPGHDYMVLGHFHVCANIPRGRGDILMNGSLTGVTEYSFLNKYKPVPPKQKIFSVTPKHGISWYINFDFDKPEQVRYVYDHDKQFYEQEVCV